MKKIVLPVACIVLFAACSNRQSDKVGAELMNIFTVTDNGITYRDTIVMPKGGGVVIARDFGNVRVMRDSTTEEGSASHFTPATDKHASMDTWAECGFACAIHKTANGGMFSMAYDLHKDVSAVIINASVPVCGAGVFSVKGTPGQEADSNNKVKKIDDVKPMSTFHEYFRDGQEYHVDSAQVNITKASGKTVEGTYKLWLTNAGTSKTVTGIISCNNAMID